MVLTAYFVLSLVSRAFLLPSPRNAQHCRGLTPASGRQDHTASPSAGCAHSPVAPSASTASRLHVRDDRDTPLMDEAGRLESLMLCLAIREAKYFSQDGWTTDGRAKVIC